MLFLLSYVRERTRHVPGTVPRSCLKEPPAGIEPAPRPYKGRVLAVDTTEALMETVGVEPTPPRCKRGALPPELRPPVDANGWSSASARRKGGRPDSNRNLEDHDLGCCRYTTTTTRPMSASPASAHYRRVRNRFRTPRNHHGPRSGPDFAAESGDDRTRTGACSPDKRVLLPLSYVPE